MVGGHGVANLFEHSGFTGSRWGHNQAASALANRRYKIDHAGLDNARISLEIEFIKWIDGSEILKAGALGVFLKRHFVHAEDLAQLRAVALVRRHETTLDEAAFAEVVAPDGVWRHKNITGFGLEPIARRAQEPESLIRDFQVTFAFLRPITFVVFCHYIMVRVRTRMTDNACNSSSNGNSPANRIRWEV